MTAGQQPTDGHIYEADARRLLRWLHEWEAVDALREADAEPESTVEHYDSRETVPGDRDPAEGQIRLVAPGHSAAIALPRYIAVLQAEDADLFLIAPYGPLATAATPGELETGRTAIGVGVLAVWNAALVPAARLQAISWFVDKMADGEKDDGLRLWVALGDDRPPPDDLRPRVGPPLSHPDDPRRTYLAGERLLMDGIRGESGEASPVTLRFVPWQRRLSGLQLKVAAEDEALYAASVRWWLADCSCAVLLTQESVASPCRLTVEDPDGQPSAILDGSVVLMRTCHVPIRNGVADLPAAMLLDGFGIVRPDGQLLAMTASD
jgi:hypothetical protein